MPAKPVVVGTDGSAQSYRAVDWAARQAARCEVPLLIASVVSVSQRAGRVTLAGDRTGVTRQMAEEALANATWSAQMTAPGLTTDTVLLSGVPAVALTRLALSASMLVVGSRGAGGIAAAGTGSVSRHLAAHAPCPVVIHSCQTPRPRPRIAVGIGEHDESEAAIAFAFEEAARRAASLLVLQSVYRFSPATFPGGGTDPAEVPGHALTRLHELLDPWQRKYPDVQVSEQIIEAGASQALADTTTIADLLVLGRHQGPRPESATRAVLDYARGPVAVVPHRETPH